MDLDRDDENLPPESARTMMERAGGVDIPARVSVIVPTKNRCAYLAEALRSIRALEGPDLDLEIIVADNGSSDDTEAVTARFAARLVPARSPGAAAARNAGLREATGDYAAFLDDDDVWLPGHLRPHLAMLRARPELGGVVGQVQSTDYRLRTNGPPYPEHLPEHGDVFMAFLADYPQIGATVVRTSVRESVGYLDESLFGGEDWDWHLRLALQHNVGFVKVPCVLFRQRPRGSSDPLYGTDLDLARVRLYFFHRVFWRNICRAAYRRPSPWLLARILGRHLGTMYAGFAGRAQDQMRAGNFAAAAESAVWALGTSPLHMARDVVRAVSRGRRHVGRRDHRTGHIR